MSFRSLSLLSLPLVVACHKEVSPAPAAAPEPDRSLVVELPGPPPGRVELVCKDTAFRRTVEAEQHRAVFHGVRGQDCRVFFPDRGQDFGPVHPGEEWRCGVSREHVACKQR